MRKIFLTFIYSFSLCFLIAQDSDQEIWSTWYMKPIHGKAKQLEKGLIDHVKKHHGQGEWPEYYFEILNGPNEGSFAAWSGPHTWKAFDERVRSQADLNHWNQYVAPFADMSDSDQTHDENGDDRDADLPPPVKGSGHQQRQTDGTICQRKNQHRQPVMAFGYQLFSLMPLIRRIAGEQ